MSLLKVSDKVTLFCDFSCYCFLKIVYSITRVKTYITFIYINTGSQKISFAIMKIIFKNIFCIFCHEMYLYIIKLNLLFKKSKAASTILSNIFELKIKEVLSICFDIEHTTINEKWKVIVIIDEILSKSQIF